MGEAGTLAGASSLASNPDIIYAGGQNNGIILNAFKSCIMSLLYQTLPELNEP